MKIKPEVMRKGVVIHCPEEWQAEALCEALDALGKTWKSGTKYTDKNFYHTYNQDTCYNIFEGLYFSYNLYKNENIKIINFYDAVIMEDNNMCEEKKYEWCVDRLNFDDITKNICSEKHLNEFKAWCFDNNNFTFTGRRADTNSETGIELLTELHKCYRKHWLEYALKEGFIQEVEETYRIGDVIELTTINGHKERYIINYVYSDSNDNYVCLNDYLGLKWSSAFTVNTIECIAEGTLEDFLGSNVVSFKKVGHGAKYLS